MLWGSILKLAVFFIFYDSLDDSLDDYNHNVIFRHSFGGSSTVFSHLCSTAWLYNLLWFLLRLIVSLPGSFLQTFYQPCLVNYCSRSNTPSLSNFRPVTYHIYPYFCRSAPGAHSAGTLSSLAQDILIYYNPFSRISRRSFPPPS